MAFLDADRTFTEVYTSQRRFREVDGDATGRGEGESDATLRGRMQLSTAPSVVFDTHGPETRPEISARSSRVVVPPALSSRPDRGRWVTSADDDSPDKRAAPRISVGADYRYSLVRTSDAREDEMVDMIRSLPNFPFTSYGIHDRPQVAIVNAHVDMRWLDETLTGPLWWVETTWFQMISACVIICNACVIGLETDIESDVWWYVEQVLLLYFFFELVLKLIRFGVPLFFQHEDDWIWNIFDFTIVASGISDQWVLPMVESVQNLAKTSEKSKVNVFFMTIRMGRLLRIVRLFKLVRIVRPLYELAQGVLEALQGMFWVLIFMVMTLYAVAILCCQLIGHGHLLSDEDLEDPELMPIRTMFSSVPESMFTLFGTISSWSLLKFVPLFDEMPFLRPFFVLFYVYSAWALLAVMTGVVSENMIAIRDQMRREDEQRESRRKAMITNTLMELFKAADADQSGTVSREEFEAMLKDLTMMKKLFKHTNIQIRELENLFDWLDHDDGGTITIDEFMQGFKWVNEPLRAKSLVKFQERLTCDLKTLEGSVTRQVGRRFDDLGHVISDPLRRVHAIAEQMQNLDVHFGYLRQGLMEQATAVPTSQDVEDVEVRLGAKLSRMLQRVEEVERGTREVAAARESRSQ